MEGLWGWRDRNKQVNKYTVSPNHKCLDGRKEGDSMRTMGQGQSRKGSPGRAFRTGPEQPSGQQGPRTRPGAHLCSGWAMARLRDQAPPSCHIQSPHTEEADEWKPNTSGGKEM